MPRHAVAVPKPYDDFPLFAHRDGRWKKKIDGVQVAFGPVEWPDKVAYLKSWQEALEAYHRHQEAVARGMQIASDPRSLDLGTLIDAYLFARHGDVEKGSLTPRTFAAFRSILREYREKIGAGRSVRQLEDDPEPIRRFVASLEERYGFHAFNRLNRYVRSMWIWGAKPESGYLDRPFKWASLHTKKPMKQFRRQRRLERASGVSKTFEPEEVAAMIKYASPFMRGVVMLGYFGGYGNTDVSQLTRPIVKVYERDEKIHLHGRPEIIPAGWALLDYPRPKTEIDRVAIVPPCVVEAIRQVEALKRPTTAETRHLVFRTEGGMPLVYDVVHKDEADLIDRTTPTDNLRLNFVRLIDRIGHCEAHGWVERKKFVRGLKDGEQRVRRDLCALCDAPLRMMEPRGFYCLRHTATTLAASSGASSDTRNLFEGHGSGGVRQAFYLDPTKLHDLLLIARDLLRRLTESAGSDATLLTLLSPPEATATWSGSDSHAAAKRRAAS